MIKLVDYVSTHAGGPSIILENISDTIGKIRMVMENPDGIAGLLQFASKNVAAVAFDISDDSLDGTLERYYLNDYTIDDINPDTQDYDSMRSGVALWSPRTSSSPGRIPMELRYTNTFRKLGGASLILSVCWAKHSFDITDTMLVPSIIGPTTDTVDEWIQTSDTTVYFPSPSPPPMTAQEVYYEMSGMTSHGITSNVSSTYTTAASLLAVAKIPSGTTISGQMLVNLEYNSGVQHTNGTYSTALTDSSGSRNYRCYKFVVTTQRDLNVGDVITETKPDSGGVQLISCIAFTNTPVDVPV